MRIGGLTQAARLEREGAGHHDLQQPRYSSEERLRKEGEHGMAKKGGAVKHPRVAQ